MAIIINIYVMLAKRKMSVIELSKRNKIFNDIMKQVSKGCIPIRTNRQNPRTERLSRAKYRKNSKRSL